MHGNEIRVVHSIEMIRPAHDRATHAARWASFAITCFGLSVLIVLGLHLALRNDVDPIRQVISDYAVSGGAVAFAAATLALAAGTLVLTAGLSRARIPLTKPVRALLAVWSGGLTLCACFRTDLSGAAMTPSGEVHRYAGIALFVSLPSATRLLARRLREDVAWQPLADRLRRLTRWAWCGLAVFTCSQLPAVLPLPGLTREALAQGLAERFVFVVYLGLLCELAGAVLRTGRKPC